MVLVRDSVPAEHVPGVARDLQRLPAVVPLQQRDHLRRVVALGMHECETALNS